MAWVSGAGQSGRVVTAMFLMQPKHLPFQPGPGEAENDLSRNWAEGLASIQTPGLEELPNEVLHLVNESATLNKGQSYLLLVLLNSPYWGRIWSVQEVMLAKDLKMVWFHDSCSRDSLISSANALSNNPVRAPSLSRLIKASYVGRFMSSRGIVRRNNSLLSFRLGHQSYCSNSRDKVYGILGFTIQVEASEFPVCYFKTLGDIWQDAIRCPNFFLATPTRWWQIVKYYSSLYTHRVRKAPNRKSCTFHAASPGAGY